MNHEAEAKANRPVKFTSLRFGKCFKHLDASGFFSKCSINGQNFTAASKKILNISEIEFKTSQGWIDRFKKRHDIRILKFTENQKVCQLKTFLNKGNN